MNNHVKIVIALFFIGIAAIAGAKFILPMFQDSHQKDTSDAKATKGKITIGVDNWIGYFPLCSPNMKKRMRRSGYVYTCEDDNADYPGRMKNLRKGKIQFAVATVDSYLLNGAAENYPGTIISVIDESKGGDAVVAWKEQIKSIDDLKKGNIKVAFTPASPSEHLLKALGSHFDVPWLLNKQQPWRVETNGSSDALKAFNNKKVPVAVLWEPDVSRALQQAGTTKILGTQDTRRLIVDVLMVNRDYAQDNADAVMTLLSNYFRVLKTYRESPDNLLKHVIAETKLPKKDAEQMLKGVHWASLNDNAQEWFGITALSNAADEGLIDTIDSALQILLGSQDFSDNPIPDEDPYRLTNSRFVSDLFSKGIGASHFAVGQQTTTDALKFSALTVQQWNRLKEVGTLRIRPIVFQSGTAELTLEGKQQLDQAVANLKHYPNFRILVKGHTGLRGDPRVNKQLSQDRAEAVSRYLQVTYDLDEHRMRAIGFGSERPLKRKPGESSRAYGYRLPRVELSLVMEEF